MKQESTNHGSDYVSQLIEPGAHLGDPPKEPTECYHPYLLADDEDWLTFMEPALCDNPIAADSFAQLLFRLKEAIESGPEGVARASFTLSDGIRLAYKYTRTHQAALRLYNLSLTGYLKPADEPLNIIREAIKRGRVSVNREIKRASKATRNPKTRRPRKK